MKNELKRLSIIIPVYNGQNTVEKCLKSILHQINFNDEVIIVNDGSNDNSLDVCNEICRSDNRVVLINQQNGGVSSARNTGIESASGKYIMFIDCDDIVIDGYFDSFLRIAATTDEKTMILSKVTTHYTGSGLVIYEGSGLENEAVLHKNKIVDIWDSHLWNAPFNKLYLSNIIKDNYIRFDVEVRMGEDWLFNNAYVRALKPSAFYILGNVAYDYYLDKDPWRHCKKEEFYEINKKQVDDFKCTLKVLDISQKEVEKFDRRDLDFIITEIRRIARDDTMHTLQRIKQIRYLAQKEDLFNRIKAKKNSFSFLDRTEFCTGSAAVLFIWENVRKWLGRVKNGGSCK